MVVRAKEERVEEVEGIGYIRQSDEREDKEDISERTQLSKIQSYCDYNGIKLVKVFKDIDYSGFRIPYTKRPGIMDALDYAESNPRLKKFVIFNLSRLTRRKNDFHKIKSKLNDLEIDLCSAMEQLDFGTATGRLVADVLVNFNEYYSDNLSDVVNDNKKTNAEKGRWNGGPAPYGLVKIPDKNFDRDGDKAVIIETMFVMALDGKGPHLIEKWTEKEGILTETGVPWTARRIRYVLQNATYAAMQKWKGVYYPLTNSATLVSWDDFQYLQKTRFGKENVWRGKERQLLSSVLRCPICGSRMHSKMTTNKKNRKYVCSNKNSTGRCPCANFEATTLNSAVVSLISKMAQKRFSPNDILPEISKEKNNDLSSLRTLQNEMRTLEDAKQKVFDDYYLHAKLSEDQFGVLMLRYEKRQKEIASLLEKIPLPQSRGYGDFDDLLGEISNAFNMLPDDKKRKSVELLVDKIVPGSPTIVKFKWGEEKQIFPTNTNKYNKKLVFF
ncbi:serine recombinase [Paenibacillus antibioticophila]|uniref:Serine recombinase n=1 Tax=Paenibacillus antibioticophila TaxID=1274374 RepID=A0A919XV02_9BACL|nr:recombinase family protein [Paenibacillus antibioticophila]GIO36918.1 serine recombinase [Paenibacillus antibioticophila]